VIRITYRYRYGHRRPFGWWFDSTQGASKVANQTVQVPLGANQATIDVLDGSGNDVTSTCTFSAVSGDPTTVAIGTPAAGTPNVIPFTSLKEGGSTTITYTAVNSGGQIVETDTLNIVVTAPASMTVTYDDTIVSPPASSGTAAPAAKK
jgi:hypothetical protein